jgi:SAM-dependent methyltransferase
MHCKIPDIWQISAEYDMLFSECGLRETDSFYQWVLRCLSPTPKKSILDVSCGEGHLLKWAIQLYKMDAWGIDLSTVALRISRQNSSQAKLVQCDGIYLPFPDNIFDYITNLGGLEHYTDILQGVKEMARVLKPEGKIAILLPNSYYLVDIIWWVWRTGYGPSHRQPLERFATVGEWKDVLSEGGIEVMHTYAYNFCFPKSKEDWQWYRKRPSRLLKLLVAPFVPFNLSYSFLFIGRKKVVVKI